MVTSADAPTLDGRIAAIMRQMNDDFGRNCRRDSDDTWRFEVHTEEARSHVVTLHVKRTIHAGRDVSRFVAYAPIGPASPSVRWEPLLQKNAELDIGAIAIQDTWTPENIRLPFVVFRATHLAATADYAEIWELVVKTAKYADDLERSVYSRDIY